MDLYEVIDKRFHPLIIICIYRYGPVHLLSDTYKRLAAFYPSVRDPLVYILKIHPGGNKNTAVKILRIRQIVNTDLGIIVNIGKAVGIMSQINIKIGRFLKKTFPQPIHIVLKVFRNPPVCKYSNLSHDIIK